MARPKKPLPDLPGHTPTPKVQYGQNAPSRQARPSGSQPTDPTLLAVMMFTAAPIGLVASALNWRRLGKPSWTGNTLLGYVLIILCLILAGVYIARTDQWSAPIALGVVIALVVLHYLYIFTVYSVQADAHKYWTQRGTTEGYTPNVGRAVALNVAVLIAAGAALVVLNVVRPVPTRTVAFDGGQITFSTPFESVAIDQVGGCEAAEDFRCLFALTGYGYGVPSMTMILSRYTLDREMDIETYERRTQDGFAAANPNFTITGVESYTLAGLPAMRRTYSTRSGDSRHGWSILTIKGTTLYEMEIYSRWSTAFDENATHIDEWLSSLVLN